MPFPQFPELPDDDPVRALKMFRKYVRNIAISISPSLLLASTIVVPTFVFVCGCWFFGFESSLSWASDLVPLTFAVISVFVSVKTTLRDEHQNIVIAFVLVLGFLAGCGKTRSERPRRRRDLHRTPLRHSFTEQASPKGLSFGDSRLNSSPDLDGRSVNGDSKTKRLH